jgi:hypothetical protein
MTTGATITAKRPIARERLNQARQCLGDIETLAHAGRVSQNPRDVMVVIRTFARPSAVLKRLAASTERPGSRPTRELSARNAA